MSEGSVILGMDEVLGDIDWAAVSQAVRQFRTIQDQEKVLKRAREDLRDQLDALVRLSGLEDDKGHLLLDLPEPVQGIRALCVQRRVSRPLDPEKAEQILKSITTSADGSTLWDDCIEWVAVLDEDKVMAARYDGLLNDAQIDEMYPKSVSEAFVPIKVGK